MGHDFRHICHTETRKLVWLMGVVFAVVSMVQYYELPYSSLISSLFSASKTQVLSAGSVPIGDLSGNNSNMSGNVTILNSSYRNAFNETPNNITKISVETERNEGLTDLIESDGDDDDPEDKDYSDVNHNPTVEKINSNNNLTLEKHRESVHGLSGINVTTTDNNSPLVSILGSQRNESVDASNPTSSFVFPPVSSQPFFRPPENVDTNSTSSVIVFNPNMSSVEKDVADTVDNSEKPGLLQSHFLSDNDSSGSDIVVVKEGSEKPLTAVVPVSEMSGMLLQSYASSRSMKPRWSSAADTELVHAKFQIENAPIIRDDPGLYAPLFWNVSVFERSYELMEQMLKVYIYKEGERPIFHQPVLKGIYASEGWFMKLLKANKQFVTKNPRKAHLFYLPFSSRMLEETLYVPNSHNRKNLVQYLKNYLDMIVGKHRFWNRTGGADHFLVACHDWAPSETKRHMVNCIRALCNADIKEGFKLGKDVSLPETFVRSAQNPLRELGGKPPSQRRILAFFAGNMHGYLRPILLQYWENKDPDMKIFGRMRKIKGQMNYVQYMKSSKYCICAKGYEVNSPRVVEAIFYECIPVIISDNFVPPFFEVLNWESFAVFVLEKDIPNLKNILLSISEKRYLEMQRRVKQVQKHFLWHVRPVKYDIFHMILHSIWYNRVFQIRPR